MPHTVDTRYAVVSCHVERILDAGHLRPAPEARRAPAGRPTDRHARPPARRRHGRVRGPWLERVRQLGDAGSLGHHTHWTSPTHARPVEGTDPARGSSSRPGGSASEVSGRRSSAAEAGIRTLPWLPAARSSGMSISRLGRGARRTSGPAEQWAELAAPARLGTGGRGADRRADDALHRRHRSCPLPAARPRRPGRPRLLPRHRPSPRTAPVGARCGAPPPRSAQNPLGSRSTWQRSPVRRAASCPSARSRAARATVSSSRIAGCRARLPHRRRRSAPHPPGRPPPWRMPGRRRSTSSRAARSSA